MESSGKNNSKRRLLPSVRVTLQVPSAFSIIVENWNAKGPWDSFVFLLHLYDFFPSWSSQNFRVNDYIHWWPSLYKNLTLHRFRFNAWNLQTVIGIYYYSCCGDDNRAKVFVKFFPFCFVVCHAHHWCEREKKNPNIIRGAEVQRVNKKSRVSSCARSSRTRKR